MLLLRNVLHQINVSHVVFSILLIWFQYTIRCVIANVRILHLLKILIMIILPGDWHTLAEISASLHVCKWQASVSHIINLEYITKPTIYLDKLANLCNYYQCEKLY